MVESYKRRTELAIVCSLAKPISEIRKILDISDTEYVNKTDIDGRSPLILACGHNKKFDEESLLVVVNLLISHGAKINIQDINGNTALHMACGFNASPKVVGLLLEKTARTDIVNKKGNTALHLACMRNAHYNVIVLLLSFGAKDIYINNYLYQNAIYFAWKFKAEEKVIDLLISAYVPRSLLDFGFWISGKKNGQLYKNIETLLCKGFDVNEVDDFGRTALHIASIFDAPYNVVQLLLDRSINVNAITKYGDSAIQSAVCSGMNTYSLMMILKNANVNILTWDKRTLLHLACIKNSDLEVVSSLLQKGVNPFQIDQYKQTALHYAICNNSPIANYLINFSTNGNSEEPKQKKARI